MCFLIATTYVAIGWGLLKLQNWARIVSIVFAGIGLGSSPATLAHFSARLFPFQVVRFGAGFVIDIWVLIYLFRPHVKKAFGADGGALDFVLDESPNSTVFVVLRSLIVRWLGPN